ncbi:MAG: hypothetical protein L3J56_07455 [Bacteroidales bacterium]|nr:hypothetical protein [Bacteroidales bacterium]
MKYLNLLFVAVFFVFSLQSCDDESNSDSGKEKTNVTDSMNIDDSGTKDSDFTNKLIDIPLKLKDETKRYEIDDELIAVDVFNAGIAMNEGADVLKKMFPDAEITQAESTEVFDSFNIKMNGAKYCAIITYEQNNQEEFVIHTIFTAKGFFKEDLAVKIFS